MAGHGGLPLSGFLGRLEHLGPGSLRAYLSTIAERIRDREPGIMKTVDAPCNAASIMMETELVPHERAGVLMLGVPVGRRC
jgi:hypothetical protein